MCEEIYASEGVRLAIDSGLPALVTNLRTHNLFPIAPFVTAIAEAVVKLYEAPGTGDVELFFDDTDLVSHLDDTAA